MNKSIKILSLSILFLVAIISSVSALDISSTTTSILQDPLTGSVTIDVTGDIDEVIDVTNSKVIDYDNNEIVFTFIGVNPITLVDNGEGIGEGTIDLDYDLTGFDFFGKKYSVIITATDNADNSIKDTLSIPFEQTLYYNGKNEGKLSISDIKIEDNDFGDDEDYWYPLDNVEVTFNVANDGGWKVKDIEIKACLWDENKGKCIMDEDDMDLNDDKFDLKSDKDKDITMNFQVDPDKLTEGNSDYTLYIKAVGEIDDSDFDGDPTGDSDYEEINIITDDTFVILDNVEITGTASCGDEIQITADVWNVGDEDQEDVDVVIYNKELGINKKITIDSINPMDHEDLDVTLTLPEDVDEKQYDLIFSIYDDGGDMYKTDEEEDKAEFFVPITIEEGSCAPSVSVYPTLESEAMAGKELTIKAVVTNTGDKAATYTLNIANYNWAVLESVEPTTIILNSGESKDVLIKFNVNKDISGDKSFNIEVLSDGKVALTQPVSVTINESTGFNLGGITGNIISGSNWYLWGIGALNVLLVIIIIVVAFRVSKKSSE